MTTTSPSSALAFLPPFLGENSRFSSASLFSASSTSASSTSATGRWTFSLDGSAGSNSGITSSEISKEKSALPASTSCASLVTLISGWLAGRIFFSSSVFCVVSGTSSFSMSPMIDSPNILRMWLAGTLPGRKPFRRTSGRISSIFASRRACRSSAGKTISNVRLKPSEDFSVTFMGWPWMFLYGCGQVRGKSSARYVMGIRAVQRREAADGCSWRDCSRSTWRG